MSLDFSIVGGDAVTLTVNVTDSSGTAIDLTGYTDIVWNVKRFDTDTTVVLTKSLGNGINITNASGGVFQASIANNDTGELSGNYRHDFVLTDAGGDEVTLSNNDQFISAGNLFIRDRV